MERRAIRIRGVVQGVGFRPAMHRLATSLGIAGFVRNDRDAVLLEVEGLPDELDRFARELPTAAPAAARIDRVETTSVVPRRDRGFRIADTPTPLPDAGDGLVPSDRGPCADCLRELLDPGDRRYRYAFTSCSRCGPRYTIAHAAPFERARTTLADHVMCAACRRELHDAKDRRYRHDTNACPECGPKARLVEGGQVTSFGDRAVLAAAAALADGGIVAIKSTGGFVLAVDATSESAVARLRARKRVPHRPFAVMGRALCDLEKIAQLDDACRAALESPARPIVIAPSRNEPSLASGVAPGMADLGVVLSPSPLQYLVLASGPRFQVVTSGNLAGDVPARTDAEAFAQLAGIADVFLVHDLEVHARADASIVRKARSPIPVRRSRGFAPDVIHVPIAGPPVLAVGGRGSNTVCLLHAGAAVMSPHVGDLHGEGKEGAFQAAIAHLEELAGVAPAAIAHDLDHEAARWAIATGLPRVEVQHHHAHLASCLADHERFDRVIGIAFDGGGMGDDGAQWGGELLDADLELVVRAGHLRPLAVAAGRDTRALAAAALVDAGESLDLLAFPAGTRNALERALASDLPTTTAAGAWLDAVAALLGVDRASRLEALAVSAPDVVSPMEIEVAPGARRQPFELDLRPAVREIARGLRAGTSRALLAARFHATLARAIREGARLIQGTAVALTGDCFQNRLLLEATAAGLRSDGYEVLLHRRVPPGDGGLALGQAAVATVQLASRSSPCL